MLRIIHDALLLIGLILVALIMAIVVLPIVVIWQSFKRSEPEPKIILSTNEEAAHPRCRCSTWLPMPGMAPIKPEDDGDQTSLRGEYQQIFYDCLATAEGLCYGAAYDDELIGEIDQALAEREPEHE